MHYDHFNDAEYEILKKLKQELMENECMHLLYCEESFYFDDYRWLVTEYCKVNSIY